MTYLKWLDNWLGREDLHFTIFVGIVTFLVLISFLVLDALMKRIARKEEQGFITKLRINSIMYHSLLILLVLFILFVPTDLIYYKQYLTLVIPLSILVGVVSSIYFNFKK